MGYTNLIFRDLILYFCKLYCKRLKSLNQGKTVFAQIMSLIPRYEFDKCVKIQWQ